MSKRKMLLLAAGAIALYILYKLFMGEEVSDSKKVAAAIGAGFNLAPLPFQRTDDGGNTIPFGPAPEFPVPAYPGEGTVGLALFGPRLPDGSY